MINEKSTNEDCIMESVLGMGVAENCKKWGCSFVCETKADNSALCCVPKRCCSSTITKAQEGSSR